MLAEKQRDLLTRFFSDMSKAVYILSVVNNLLLKQGFSLKTAFLGFIIGTLFLGMALHLGNGGGES